MDYIFPNWVTKMLRTPSERTQMESSLVGIAVMILGSLAIASYLLINQEMSGWFKFLIGASTLGILSFQFSILSTTYQAYHSYKLELGLYPEDYQLKLKIEEAIRLRDDLTKLIKTLHKK